jgi:methylenetetrahydrofolate dehydrogenase (NADP+)/methenyltetrahydrofolate cyclohydrolase
MQLLDGKKAAEAIREELRLEVAQRVAEGKKTPHLAAILVGNNGASETYVGAKVKACQEVGFRSTLIRLEASVAEPALLRTIEELNRDPDIDGILVQLPLPETISDESVINAIDPEKDVDGFHPVNVGRMVQGHATYIPATPHGILLLLKHYRIDTKGKHAVVIGRSNIVGRPMSILLSANTDPGNCTVTVCHSKTPDIREHCLRADIIVAAVGQPGFVKADMVRSGAVVVDVGITRVPDPTRRSGFRLEGDVDFGPVSSRCSWITPVPGGVGPMTIAALLKNTFQSCIEKNG